MERAIKVFREFGLIEILTDGAYYMTDIQLLIGQSSSEGERKKKERMRLKRQKLLPSGEVDICPPEIRDKSIENRECESAHAYGRYKNVFFRDEELTELQTELPTLWQNYIDRAAADLTLAEDEYIDPADGLLLFGDVGTGKSFFAGCIANALLDRDIPVLMTNFPSILNRLTGMFSEDRAEFIAGLGMYDLLIIDDLGVERNTEYAMEQM